MVVDYSGPGMETAVVVGGCWPRVDAAMELDGCWPAREAVMVGVVAGQ